MPELSNGHRIFEAYMYGAYVLRLRRQHILCVCSERIGRRVVAVAVLPLTVVSDLTCIQSLVARVRLALLFVAQVET